MAPRVIGSKDGGMAFRGVALMAVASSLLLAGCAAPASVPAGPSVAEIDSVVQQQLDSQWDSYPGLEGAMKPQVDRVAFTSAETWASMQVSCLNERGIDAREVSGGYTVEGLDDPVAARVAMWVCLGEYPRDPRDAGYLSDPQILYMYDFYVSRLGPCMKLLGYAVSDPPAREDYVDRLRSGNYWSPYFAEGWEPQRIDVEKWERVDFECGRLPDDPYHQYHPLSWVEGR
ncbi:MAG: hypothetical protein JWP85_789 [Rhodoglobus sp.]|nr:hypothetical protein [Rhodoglobus sp.]